MKDTVEDQPGMERNADPKTVSGFGFEWRKFDQSKITQEESGTGFQEYFKVFPWQSLPVNATGFDLGCGSGRWARQVASRVAKLICLDASPEAAAVAKANLAEFENCVVEIASVDHMPMADASMDFGYSLGVLHHIPDTAGGIRSCVAKLKPGAPFLVYLYYAFDNRPAWYRLLWKTTDLVRRGISACPHRLRYGLSQLIAASVYFPLARLSGILESLHWDVSWIPLSYYRNRSFYTMRTDALDRFGTGLEQRFTRAEIADMMAQAGLERIVFSDGLPYWCAVGYRRA